MGTSGPCYTLKTSHTNLLRLPSALLSDMHGVEAKQSRDTEDTENRGNRVLQAYVGKCSACIGRLVCNICATSWYSF